MPNDSTIRWTVWVSTQTDTLVRTFLAERGMQEADFSKFIEEAVKWRVFDQTLAEVRSKFADLPAEDVETLVEEAVGYARVTNDSKAIWDDFFDSPGINFGERGQPDIQGRESF